MPGKPGIPPDKFGSRPRHVRWYAPASLAVATADGPAKSYGRPPSDPVRSDRASVEVRTVRGTVGSVRPPRNATLDTETGILQP